MYIKSQTKDEEEIELKPFLYTSQQLSKIVHHFYISSIIEEPIKYVDMVFRIQTAGPEDIVYIHLNTPGGVLDTGVQIINAMKSTPAHVIAALEGEVASLGTMIFLAADEFVVHDNSSLMIHNYSGGVWGKGHEQIAALTSATKWMEDFMRRMYVPFMTEEEVQRILGGEDLYIHPPEIRERLLTMVQELERQLMEEESESEPETKPKRTTKKKPAKKKTSAK